MACCSQRRHAAPATPQLRAAMAASHSAAPGAPPAPTTQRLRYLRDTSLSLRGPFSGRVYEVDARACFIDADARDAVPLLRTALFERAA